MESIINYINLLEANKNLVLTGARGTGKTYLAKKIAESMGANVEFVQFHSSYNYTDFVEKNEGFINTDTTDKIQLIGHLDNLSKEEIDKIEQKIQDVIHTGKLEELREFCDKI